VVTFLGAAFDQSTLVDALQNGSLVVEIRDRDLRQPDMLERLAEKWETLYHGNGDSLSSHVDVFAIDQVALADWRAALAQARRLFAYGLATFRLNELLNRVRGWFSASHHLDSSMLMLIADITCRISGRSPKHTHRAIRRTWR